MAKAKRRPVIWSADAEEDLFQIWHYLAENASRAIADRTVRDIHLKCRRLRQLPFSGRPRDDLLPGIRSLLAHPYIVFYRVTDNSVEVARLFHGSRNIEAVFRLNGKAS